MPDGPAYCVGMAAGLSGNGNTENGVAGVRVAAGRHLASYSLPRRQSHRGIATARYYPPVVANRGVARGIQAACRGGLGRADRPAPPHQTVPPT